MTDNDRRTTRRRFLEATGAAAGAVALAGCSGGQNGDSGGGDGGGNGGAGGTAGGNGGTSDGSGASGQKNASGRLDLINASMTSFDPVAAADTASGAVATQVFDGLMTYPNGEVPVTTEIATKYDLSDDFTTYTFELKKGVTFHDGSEVTATDFVYSYERLAGSQNSEATDDILNAVGITHETDADGEYKPGTLSTEAVDKYTFRFEIEKPFASALQVLANSQFAVVPEGIVGDVPGYEGKMPYKRFANSPVGAGPFTFESYQSGTAATVERFGDYHGNSPKIDGVHWQVIEDTSASYNYAMEKNVDVFDIPTAQYDPEKVKIDRTDDQGREFGSYGPLRNGETVSYLGVPTLSVFYIGFNMPEVPKPVRQAVAYALDQSTVVEQVFKDRGLPAYHYTIPSIYPGGPKAYERHAKRNYPYGYNETQLDEARRVMRGAGYGPNDKYDLQFSIYEDETWMQTAQLLRDQLSSAHVNMSIQQIEFSTLLERIEKGTVSAYSLGWVVPWAAPDAFVKHLNPATSDTSSSSPEAYNNWPEDTKAAKRAVSAWNRIEDNPEPTKQAKRARNEAYVAMEEANWEDMANLPVYHELTGRFWYDSVDIPPFGIAGDYKQKFNTVTLSS